MKKYVVTHDTVVLGVPTIGTNDCTQITDANMGLGKGQILYGIVVPRKRLGNGMQNFLLIGNSIPEYPAGKEIIGKYVPISAVKEIRETPVETPSNSVSRGTNEAQSSEPVVAEEKNYTASNIIIGIGLLLGAILIWSPAYKKYSPISLGIIAIGFAMSLYKQWNK